LTEDNSGIANSLNPAKTFFFLKRNSCCAFPAVKCLYVFKLIPVSKLLCYITEWSDASSPAGKLGIKRPKRRLTMSLLVSPDTLK
jgi:hypothetical protein